jgi:hypothetical protein
LPCSQQSANCPCPERHASSPHSPTSLYHPSVCMYVFKAVFSYFSIKTWYLLPFFPIHAKCSTQLFFLLLLFIIILSRVRLRKLDTAATTGLLYQIQMTDDGDCGTVGGMKIGRGSRSTRRSPAPVSLYPPQIPHDLTRAQTRATAVGSQRLTGWAMARSSFSHIQRLTPSFRATRSCSQGTMGTPVATPEIPCNTQTGLPFRKVGVLRAGRHVIIRMLLDPILKARWELHPMQHTDRTSLP